MMHAKSESDVTSLDQSSPRSSPKRAVYYVQSPSRDSHDGDKSSSSIHATTPVFHSPTESPSHPSYSAYGRQSRASSASRFSGPFRSKGSRRRSDRGWPECSVIEEGGYSDLSGRSEVSRRCQCLIALLGFAGAFGLFCLVIWGASRPYKVEVAVKSLVVDNFYFGLGSDLTGVPTKFLTVNCSLKMKVRNPATFFGIHVSSSPVNLFYSQLTVATGQLKRYYQPRKSQRTVSVKLEGSKVPLYGAGEGLAVSEVNGGVPLVVLMEVHSRGNVVGALVKSKHQRHVSCHLVINPHSTKEVVFKDKSCTYK